MSEHVMRDRAARLLRRRGSLSSSTQSAETRRHGDTRRETRNVDSMSTVSYMDEPGCHDDSSRSHIQLENTYHLAPPRVFPVLSARLIALDVLSSYLVSERYEPELCRQISKTVSEVIKARVKDLEVSRFKLAVLVHIGGGGGAVGGAVGGSSGGAVGGSGSGGVGSGVGSGGVGVGGVGSGGVGSGGVGVKGVEATAGRACEGAVRVVSRCLWDPSTDTVVSATLTRHGLYAVATVYAVYYE